MSRHGLSVRFAVSVALLACGSALSGCQFRHGIDGTRFSVAQQPRGIDVRAELGRDRFEGELVAVRDTVLILDRGELIALPSSRLKSVDLRDAARRRVHYRISGKGLAHPDTVQLLTRLSRFPQGLTPEIEAALLSQRAQPALRVVAP